MARQTKQTKQTKHIKEIKEIKKGKTPKDPKIPRLPPVKKGGYVSSGPNDLFDNPMTRAAMAALSDEDKEKYKKFGEYLYDQVNYDDCELVNNLPAPMAEAVAYLESQLNSGFHPSMMESNEKELMKEQYGAEWYTRWGYVQEDLDDIVTLEFNREFTKESIDQ